MARLRDSKFGLTRVPEYGVELAVPRERPHVRIWVAAGRREHVFICQGGSALLRSKCMLLRHFGLSDRGKVRANNEDTFLADPQLGLFVVCDGVGGRARGEVASRETAGYIWEWVKRHRDAIEEAANDPAGPATHVSDLCSLVRGAIQNACYMVHGLGQLDPDRRGMSTTASVLLVVERLGVIGQVGDSRVYLLREDKAAQLTEDHTLLNYQLKHGLITEEQARKSSSKNVITRAIGHRDYVDADVRPIALHDADRLLLCSDGLHGYFEAEGEIESLIGGDLEEAVRRAVDTANARGGGDNITALIVDCLELEASTTAPTGSD